VLYLIRHVESGRENQRHGQQRDMIAALGALVPPPRVRAETGRIFVEAEGEIGSAIGAIHGVWTFSPCVRCPIDELEPCALTLAALAARASGPTFAVRVRRVGARTPGRRELAARLGQAIRARFPELRVDLRRPTWTLGVEIRGTECYLFDQVIKGRDRVLGPAALPAGTPRFLVDHMLGRLAAWLRILGFDAEYARDEPDSVLLRRAAESSRVLVTRDRELARASGVSVLLLSSDHVDEQLVELLGRLRLRVSRRAMFSRCTSCNRELQALEKRDAEPLVPPIAYRLFDSFTRCPGCGKVYWRGGHYERILARVAPLIEGPAAGPSC
jgi:uncharacterized protein with PIN domain